MTKKPIKNWKASGRRKPPIPGVKKSVKNSHTSPSKINRQKNIAAALEHRLHGRSYPKISILMDAPISTVFTWVEEGLKQVVREPAEALREIELERINLLLAAHMDAAAEGHIEKTNVVLRILERRAKLLGLDRPQQLDVSGALATAAMIGHAPTDTERARHLAAFIALARARKEAEQQAGSKDEG